MMTSNKICLRRTVALFNKYVIENWRGLALKVGLMFGMMLLAALLIVWGSHSMYDTDYIVSYGTYWGDKDRGWDGVAMMMVSGLFLFGTVAASLTFSDMSTKERRLSVITFPALQIEKYIVRLIIFIPIFLILFALSCLMMETTRYLLLKAIVEEPDYVRFITVDYMLYDTVNGVKHVTREIKAGAWAFVGIQAFFCLGSAVWHKAAFVKTFIFGGILGIVYAFIVYLTIESLGSADYAVEAYPDSTLYTIYRCVITAVMAFCYITAYYRFKESEIIDRW